MGNTNYANANRDTTGNTTLLDTGETRDEKCHIFDMAGNVREWITEDSTRMNGSDAFPCTNRGGDYYYSHIYAGYRYYNNATISDNELIGFRTSIYVK